ncbi:FAD/NAD(P)-binding domain-containing protein [Penicillium capsulatum]|uniref:FAD/NAD(P)-binding domain-containing protein n=1 Tax=Penicillium capsulatum TaxID=69766 RepID=A0A9W9IYB7_9EURO|nr:FAD/NAD(P)-binding domain-containing protein [Penicillium capsulatum]KAJ6129207.1 FAD/NAD(P)-binding domain-containing protein [Penicillium capsulatum]
MTNIEIDALVVGAGFGGIHATYRLSRTGLNVQCIDKAGDVGGTWYWSRFPGAASDVESYLYRYSWDKEDLRSYPWTHHYLTQPEILAYLRHVVDRHDLRRYMRFNIEMTAATWNDDAGRWHITGANGQTWTARYLVNALGVVDKVHWPAIPGLSSFAGDLIHTARWGDVDLAGKKVGVIGNGSTGIQLMQAIAPIVGKLTSFQRNPQYTVPSGQGPIPEGYREQINANYDQIFEGVWSSRLGFGFPESHRQTMEASPEERRRAFQEVWDKGNGFRFMFGAFGDLTYNREANQEACKFIHGKIDEIVQDPHKAAILKPTEPYARRPPCDAGYYHIFNRDNVDLVSLKSNPIQEVIPEGVRLADGTVHELDVLVCATGFDAVEGGYLDLHFTGRNGRSIQEHWKDGPTAWGGITCAGFPNMFILGGPLSAFANFPTSIEASTDLIMAYIAHVEGQASAESSTHPPIMDVTEDAEQSWFEVCRQLTEGSLFKEAPSWIFRRNIPGRETRVLFYFGGLKSYCDWAKEQIAGGFPAFIPTTQVE